MFVWIRDKGIAQSDSGKGGTLWTGGAIVGKLAVFLVRANVIRYDDANISCVK